MDKLEIAICIFLIILIPSAYYGLYTVIKSKGSPCAVEVTYANSKAIDNALRKKNND